jgi:hypothetical protein
LTSEIDYSKMSCFIKDLITNSPAGDLKEIAEVNARFSEYKMNSLEQPQANAVVSHVEHAGLEKAGDVLLKAMVHIKIQEQ